ncbi:MAG: hypothetical protein EP298_09585 [Gammaproteobacteria bacterium]|nr:MAG: hypothetical protein EP298_09585 [Gammaproteobacteria bacterium]UTW42272.1 hypothetical protein KFE69_12400 [bacterium SCSIO 12844]
MNPYFANLEIIQAIDKKLDKCLLVPEEVSSVVEANSDYFLLDEYLFTYWQTYSEAVQKYNCILCGIGSLPTFIHKHLADKNLTKAYRYRNLVNNINLNRYNVNRLMSIQGKESVLFQSNGLDFMGAASAQHIHLRVPFKNYVDYYNASLIASAILIAISSNSLYFLSHELWHESRIAIFEHLNFLIRRGHCPRVFLGDGYLEGSFLELYRENIQHLPLLCDLNLESEDPFWHLKYHNGTVWRWNRPVIDTNNDNKLHLGIENRVLSAAPSVIDTVANTAFYIGLVHEIVSSYSNYRLLLPFEKILCNFYLIAQKGIHANLYWFDDVYNKANEIILPMARAGLAKLKVDSFDNQYFIDIIQLRLENKCNLSDWQKQKLMQLDGNFNELVLAYHQNQLKNIPLCDWKLS